VARAAAPASAALILGHGTTDALRGTAPEDYIADLARVVAVLREAGAPDMPVLQAPLPRLAGRMEILGRGRPAAWLAPEGEASALARWGLLRFSPLPAETVAGAAAIRAAQAEAARRLGLLPGGDLSVVALLADGIHWNRDGVRKAVSQAAEALASALR
jgi:hypothetical protein